MFHYPKLNKAGNLKQDNRGREGKEPLTIWNWVLFRKKSRTNLFLPGKLFGWPAGT